MTVSDQSSPARYAIGIDVGGTKCAAGLVVFPEGRVIARRWQPTQPQRGGDAVLTDVVNLALSLQQEAIGLSVQPAAVGLGVAELVSVDGRVLSEATIRWKGAPVRETLQAATHLPVAVEADVRAAACGEAHLGGGRRFRSFLYVTIGTGISASFVLNRIPYSGARGLTGTFASSRGLIPSDDGELACGPPLEEFAAGPALASRFAARQQGFAGSAPDVIALAEASDSLAQSIAGTAAQAVGAAIGNLVNMLDPEAVIIGGGLGSAEGYYRNSLVSAMRNHIWSDYHRDLPVRFAELGNDAGFIGAALAAVNQ
jgi:predicted NBD/HSP70 family sugar kinase